MIGGIKMACLRKGVISVFFVSLFLAASVLQAEVKGEAVQYYDGDVPLKGYLVLPDTIYATGQTPAAILVHEWWGHDEFIKEAAIRLAKELGIVAFAIDMFGNGRVAKHPEDAKRFSGEILKTKGLREKRFRAALKYLSSHSDVDKEKIVALGFCFGGSTVLDMARLNLPLSGVVSFHGGLDSKIEGGKIASRILVFVGEHDTLIPKEERERFQNEMRQANADAELLVLAGARHSFMNPRADEYKKEFGLDMGYHQRAAELAWSGTYAFIRQLFPRDKRIVKEKPPCIGCGIWDESSSVKG